MKIVSDSSSLIALYQINRLDILESNMSCLVIPGDVNDEVVIKGHGKPGATEVKEAKWIVKTEVSDFKMAEKINEVLHIGESEAIVFANKINSDLIILDDQKAGEHKAQRADFYHKI